MSSCGTIERAELSNYKSKLRDGRRSTAVTNLYNQNTSWRSVVCVITCQSACIWSTAFVVCWNIPPLGHHWRHHWGPPSYWGCICFLDVFADASPEGLAAYLVHLFLSPYVQCSYYSRHMLYVCLNISLVSRRQSSRVVVIRLGTATLVIVSKNIVYQFWV